MLNSKDSNALLIDKKQTWFFLNCQILATELVSQNRTMLLGYKQCPEWEEEVGGTHRNCKNMVLSTHTQPCESSSLWSPVTNEIAVTRWQPTHKIAWLASCNRSNPGRFEFYYVLTLLVLTWIYLTCCDLDKCWWWERFPWAWWVVSLKCWWCSLGP